MTTASKKRTSLVAAVLLPLLAPAAQAGGLYAGAGLLSAGFNEEPPVVLDPAATVAGYDESDSGHKLFGGVRYAGLFGVEAAYFDLGEPNDGLVGLDVTAWNLAARGILPLGPIELFVKAGLWLWDADTDSPFIDDDTNEFGYGAGVAARIKKIELRLEYDQVDFDSLDVDVVSLGAAWHF